MARIALTPNMLHQFLVIINNLTVSNDSEANISSKPCFSSSNLIEILSIYRQYLTVDSVGLNGGTALHSLSIKRRNYMLEHPNSWLPSVMSRLIDTNPIISVKALAVLEEIAGIFDSGHNTASSNKLDGGGIFDPSLLDGSSDTSSLNSSSFVLPEPFCKCLLQIFERQIGNNSHFNQNNNTNEKQKKVFLFDLFSDYFKQAWASHKIPILSNSNSSVSCSVNGEPFTFSPSSNNNTKTVFLNNDVAQHAFNIWRAVFRCFSAIYHISFTGSSTNGGVNGSQKNEKSIPRLANYLFFKWKYWQHWISLILDQVKSSKDLYCYHEPFDSLLKTPIDTSLFENHPPIDIDEFRFRFLRSIFFEWIHFSTMVMTASFNPAGSICSRLNGSPFFDLCFPFSENFELQGLSMFELFKLIDLPPIHPYESHSDPGKLSHEFSNHFQTNKSVLEKFEKQVHLIGSLRSTIYKSLVFVITSVRIAGIYPQDLSNWHSDDQSDLERLSGCTQDWIKIWDEYLIKFFEVQLSNISVPVAELVLGIQVLFSGDLYNRNDLFTKNRIQSVLDINSLNSHEIGSFSKPFYPKAATNLVKLYIHDPTLTKTNIEEIGRASVDRDEETTVSLNNQNENILCSDVVGMALAISLRIKKSLRFTKSNLRESFYSSLFLGLPRQNISIVENNPNFATSSIYDMSNELWRDTCILLLKLFIHGNLGLQNLPSDVFGIFLELMSFCFSIYIKELKSMKVLDELFQLAFIFSASDTQHSKKSCWGYLVNFNVETFEFSLSQEDSNMDSNDEASTHKESLDPNEKLGIAVLPFNVAFGIAIISATQVVFSDISKDSSCLSESTLKENYVTGHIPVCSESFKIFKTPTENVLNSFFKFLGSFIPFTESLELLENNSKESQPKFSFDSHYSRSIFDTTLQTLASVEYNPYFPINRFWSCFVDATTKSLNNFDDDSKKNSLDGSNEHLLEFQAKNNDESIRLIVQRYGVLFRLYNSLVIQLHNYKNKDNTGTNDIGTNISRLESSFLLILVSFFEKSKVFINAAAKNSVVRRRKSYDDNEKSASLSKISHYPKMTRSVKHFVNSKDISSQHFNSYHCQIYLAIFMGKLFCEIWSSDLKEQMLLTLTKCHTEAPKRIIVQQ